MNTLSGKKESHASIFRRNQMHPKMCPNGQKIIPITLEQKEAKYQQALKDQREGNLKTAFN